MERDKNPKEKFELIEMESAFKHIRNRLRKYYPQEIIGQCVYFLARPGATSTDNIIQYKPLLRESGKGTTQPNY